MTLTVEDGTIVSGANSYVSLANAQTYWGNWGYSLTDITTGQQTAALIQAAYALDKVFGRFYIGTPAKNSPQALCWPRQYQADSHTLVQITDSTGADAKLLVRIIDGALADVYVVEGGQDYTSPTLNIYGSGHGATATAAVTSGAISSVTITNAGEGYWTPDELTANDYSTIAINEIPQALQDAQCEIAWIALQGGSIFPQLSDEQKLKQRREQFGNINLIQTYDNPFLLDGERLQGFRKVELILEPLVNKRIYAI